MASVFQRCEHLRGWHSYSASAAAALVRPKPRKDARRYDDDQRRRTRVFGEDAADALCARATGAFVGVALDVAAPPGRVGRRRRAAWRRYDARRAGGVVVGVAFALAPGDGVYVATPPVPPAWGFEKKLIRDSGLRNFPPLGADWTRLPEAAVRVAALCAGFAQSRRPSGNLIH